MCIRDRGTFDRPELTWCKLHAACETRILIHEATRVMSEVELTYDMAILGAGATGLMAAIRAAETGKSVALIEKNRRPGVKILMSGGTRCNLTNARGLRN